MGKNISRRPFLGMVGSILAGPLELRAAEPVPTTLDHIILGSRDLERGMAFVEERTGVRAALGGVHPGRGTRNALLSLGKRRYLEILALDPKQTELNWYPRLRELSEPRLIGWSVHTRNIVEVARQVRNAGLAAEGPMDGSRARPDGKMLRWKNLRLKDDRGGLLPFIIEWSRESIHPSVDSPAGCRLERFVLGSPDPRELEKTLRLLGVQPLVEHAETPGLRARLVGPRGVLEITS